jgi:hypothetical protein
MDESAYSWPDLVQLPDNDAKLVSASTSLDRGLHVQSLPKHTLQVHNKFGILVTDLSACNAKQAFATVTQAPGTTAS